jgi:hypothetical protein
MSLDAGPEAGHVPLGSMLRNQLIAECRRLGLRAPSRKSVEELREEIRQAYRDDPQEVLLLGWKRPISPGKPWTPITRTVTRKAD